MGTSCLMRGKTLIVSQKGPQPNAPRSYHCRTPAKGTNAAERLRPWADHVYEAKTNVRGGERPVRLPHRNHSNTVKADTHAGRSGE